MDVWSHSLKDQSAWPTVLATKSLVQGCVESLFKKQVRGTLVITANTLQMGDEKSQYAVEINVLYGMWFLCFYKSKWKVIS